ncbi:N-6 DNA methylase [Humisphaera borealis]|uniref:site-specific DNA-methyltransferase (adenine-specific) n=1 Tax=Humisphaera borealis TaxID=2807512 RepID=A0A7M2WWG3_9BACT|nr:N-6 DNA methylase [Humisphaera borealis]QOV89888.1 N-6 DNA methylase [Humisphaera borealis]
MTTIDQKQLGKTLWAIADDLRGAMNADDFRDYMLAFLFLRYLSDNYEAAAKNNLKSDYPDPNAVGNGGKSPLSVWYAKNPSDVALFEKQMRQKVHYVIKPEHLWTRIAHMARTQDGELLHTLQAGFKYIENESFESTFGGLFSEINLGSEKLGRTYEARNAKLCTIIGRIAEGLAEFSTSTDTLGDAYEYLIGQFAAGSGKKAGEFYTPQPISDILSGIVTLDSQEPATGPRKRLESVMDFACGSGSLLLNVRKRMGKTGIGKIYGQENNITTYNLARMNMLLHGVKDTEFEIYHGDTLKNEWDMLREMKKPEDVLFINAAEGFVKGKRQNVLTDAHITRIVETYQHRPKLPVERYARRVAMKEIAENDFNLNISRYVSTAEDEEEIDLAKEHESLVQIDARIRKATAEHNAYLKELGLPLLP